MYKKKQNILYLSGIHKAQKYGFYNAVYNRMRFLKKINKEKTNFNFVSVPSVDGYCARVLKSIIGLPINLKAKQERSFLENIPLKKSLFDYILNLVNKNHFEDKLYKIILELCIERKITFIHVHWAYPYGYVVSKISQEHNIPYVLNVHGSDIHTHPFKNKRLMHKTVQALNHAKEIYYVSGALYDEAKKFPNMTNKDFKITGNGVEIPLQVSPMIDKKLHICFIGLLTKTKGADRLIPIFKKIRLIIPDIKLTIIGEGEYFEQIKNEILENGLNIALLGYKTNEEIENLRVNYDLSIVPSRAEGFGLSVLESYAHNIPVIASKCGGMVDLVLDKELLVENDIHYIDDICSTIVQYYNGDYGLYQARREKAEYTRYAKEYNWSKIVKIESEKY